MTKTYSNCQSCGMPLKQDKGGGGTEADGSKSLMYCSLCYVGGKFTNPKIKTAADMQVFVIDVMKKMGFPRPLGWLFTRGIPKLERWRNTR